jgi:hypothetical protein
MNKNSVYQQIKTVSIDGKNIEDTEVRHPSVFENITQDRDIKGAHRLMNNNQD